MTPNNLEMRRFALWNDDAANFGDRLLLDLCYHGNEIVGNIYEQQASKTEIGMNSITCQICRCFPADNSWRQIKPLLLLYCSIDSPLMSNAIKLYLWFNDRHWITCQARARADTERTMHRCFAIIFFPRRFLTFSFSTAKHEKSHRQWNSLREKLRLTVARQKLLWILKNIYENQFPIDSFRSTKRSKMQQMLSEGR